MRATMYARNLALKVIEEYQQCGLMDVLKEYGWSYQTQYGDVLESDLDKIVFTKTQNAKFPKRKMNDHDYRTTKFFFLAQMIQDEIDKRIESIPVLTNEYLPF